MKNFLKLSMFLLGAVIAIAIFVFKGFALDSASSPAGQLLVDVPPGSTFMSLRAQLELEGLSIPRLPLRIWARVTGAGGRLRSGEFLVDRAWTPKRIFEEITNGTPVLHKITVREGLNIYDVQTEFAKAWPAAGSADSFGALLTDEKFLARMNVPPALPPGVRRTLEGFLFPETYSFQKYDGPRAVLDAMLTQYEARVLPILKTHPWGSTPEGRYRLLTLASVVEKESGLVQEQPVIASVFWNRLAKKMRLQSDPTTIYGLLPNFDGNLKKIHLLAASPYNTYAIAELPAGPICNPGETAVRAVVQPATTKYLYFVSKNDGTHVFSETYAEHAAHVRNFQMNRARGK